MFVWPNNRQPRTSFLVWKYFGVTIAMAALTALQMGAITNAGRSIQLELGVLRPRQPARAGGIAGRMRLGLQTEFVKSSMASMQKQSTRSSLCFRR
jgi:hypothetical protein